MMKVKLMAVIKSLRELIMKSLCESILRGDKCNLGKNDANALLLWAAKNGRPGLVRPLHEKRVDFDHTDDDGKTVVFYGNKDFLGALFAVAKVSVNTRDRRGRTPLYCALIEDDDETKARYLIENGANPQLKDKYDVSILTFYVEKCISRSIEVTELFSCQLFQTEQKALSRALLNVLYCQAPLLSVSDPRHLQFLENKSYTIIKKQMFLDALVFVRDLLKKNTEEKIRDVKIDVPSVLSLLIELGAEPEAVDSNGNTPLHYAALLPLFDEMQNDVMKILYDLRFLGTSRSALNRNDQTALLLCLSTALEVITEKNTWQWSTQGLIEVCRFLLEHTNDLRLKVSQSILHIVISLVNPTFELEEASRDSVLQVVIGVFKLLEEKKTLRVVVNDTDFQSNSPLHLWATIELKSPEDYRSPFTGIFTFESVLETILKYLHKNGANPNYRNHRNETPLHMCRTWTAVNLLLDIGANPNDLNTLGHSSLFVAAVAKKNQKNNFSGYLYSDVTVDPDSFWRTALKKNLDPWIANNQGETLLSVLLKSNDRALSTALVDVTCNRNFTTNDTRLLILEAICKDESTNTHWKTNLVKVILKSAKAERIDVDSASRLCCQNIVTQQMANDKASDDDGEPPTKKAKNDEKKNSDHYKILKELLQHGTNVYDLLEIATSCELLQNLLTRQVENEISCVYWTPESHSHKPRLDKVAMRQEYILLPSKNIWYHKDEIARGSYGDFYAGINGETSCEICVKSIKKSHLKQQEDIKEQKSLDALAGCKRVVQRVHFIQTPKCCYLISELMEGNLEHLIKKRYPIDAAEKIRLAKLVVKAVKCLHERGVLHYNLKPENILYKEKDCKTILKIANFSQSCISDKVPKCTARQDIFSCGKLLYYILSGHKHPPCSIDSTGKREMWDEFPFPEGTHLIKKMLESKQNSWPSAAEALKHPLFWPSKRKMDFINAVANREEFAKNLKWTQINKDLDKAFPEFKRTGWDQVKEMPYIYHVMTKDYREYDTSSPVDLVRFIRNTYQHYPEKTFHTDKPIEVMLLEDFMFLNYFPKLLIEVYKAVISHGWDKTIEEIKFFFNKTK